MLFESKNSIHVHTEAASYCGNAVNELRTCQTMWHKNAFRQTTDNLCMLCLFLVDKKSGRCQHTLSDGSNEVFDRMLDEVLSETSESILETNVLKEI